MSLNATRAAAAQQQPQSPFALRKAHWSEDPRVRAEGSLQDGRHALRQALPDRERPMTRSTVVDFERAILRAGLAPAVQRLLLAVLGQTDGPTHVCYRHRSYLVEALGSHERRVRLEIARLEEVGVLTRLSYRRHDPRLRPQTTEWHEGCWFLRWEVATGEALQEALRGLKFRPEEDPNRPQRGSKPILSSICGSLKYGSSSRLWNHA